MMYTFNFGIWPVSASIAYRNALSMQVDAHRITIIHNIIIMEFYFEIEFKLYTSRHLEAFEKFNILT